jgi:hypothetical protein
MFLATETIESAIKTGKLAHLLIELKKVPAQGEKRKEIFMVHQEQASVKRYADHIEPWMSQEIIFPQYEEGTLPQIR